MKCEKILANHISDKKSTSRIYKDLLKLNNNETTQLKMNKGFEKTFL